jgi:hypothetical protein
MIQTKSPPEVDDPSGELDALIEEARRRARKRRLIVAGALSAGILAAGGAFLLFGDGDGGGGSSDGSVAGGPTPGAASSGSSSASAATNYRCPTSRQELRALTPPGLALPGCKVTLLAELPAGWEQSPTSIFMSPERGLGFVGYLPVRFASFGLAEPNRHPLRPFTQRVPADDLLLTAQLATSRPDRTATSASLEEGDFRTAPRREQPFAFTNLDLDGVEFRIDATAGSEPIDPGLLKEANAVLASLDTSQKLCPCVGENVTLPGVTLKEIDRSAAGGVAD